MIASHRIVMLGTKDFALPLFEALLDAGQDVRSLTTQPDRPQGRKQELIPSRIKLAAIDRGVAVYQPEDVNDSESVDHIRSLAPDFLVTAAYGQILSSDLLGVPKIASINLHGSLLPAYRGAAPVARAIQDGVKEAGVTVIQMTPRVDAGGMISFARTSVGPDETAGELEARLAVLGAPLVLDAMDLLAGGKAEILPQDRSLVTRAPKLRKEDGLIDWSLSASQIHNLVRAMQPWPTASTLWQSMPKSIKGPMRLIVHKTAVIDGVGEPGIVLTVAKDEIVVAAGVGAVRLLTVQPPSKKPMSAADFLRGNHVRVGDRMGETTGTES